MAKDDDKVEFNGVAAVPSKGPTPFKGPNELISGINNMRTQFAQQNREAAINQPQRRFSDAFTGKGLFGDKNVRRGPQPTPGTMDDAGIGVTNRPNKGAVNPEMPANRPGANQVSTAYLVSDEAVRDARNAGSGPAPVGRGSTSPAGKVVPGADYNSGDRLASPAFLAYQKDQQSRSPGQLFKRDGTDTISGDGTYGSGKTPLTANYDRAGEAALVQQRRNATSAFLNQGNADRALQREKTFLTRRANQRLNLNDGLSTYFTKVNQRRRASEGLEALNARLLQGDKDKNALTRQKAGDDAAFDRTLLTESGKDRRSASEQASQDSRTFFTEGEKNRRKAGELAYKYDSLAQEKGFKLADLMQKGAELRRKLNNDQFDRLKEYSVQGDIALEDLYLGNALLNEEVNVALSKSNIQMGGEAVQAIPADLTDQTPEQAAIMSAVTKEYLKRREDNQGMFSSGKPTDLQSILNDLFSQGGVRGAYVNPPKKSR